LTPFQQARLERAGLGELAVLRLGSALPEGSVAAQLQRFVELTDNVDLMALGALADELRIREVQNEVFVRIELHGQSQGLPDTLWASQPNVCIASGTGLSLLREVAKARIFRRPGTTVAVDFNTCGLELAQVALGFGASGLHGVLSNKRGLPIATGDEKRVKGEGQVSLLELQRREIVRVLRGGRREAIFVGDSDLSPRKEDPHVELR
jgi:hypothetical protein